MQKAAFFDRDGVINDNSQHYYVYRIEDFKFNDGVIELMKAYQQKDFLIIIISNQSGIGRKVYTINDVEILHQHVKNELLKHGITITEIYFCPHHPSTSNCLCRKPNSLLLEKAIARFDIDVEKSLLIGDSQRDIEAAQKVGLKGIKVPANALPNLPDF